MKQQSISWQQVIREMITDPLELLSILEIPAEQIPWRWDKDFPLRVTKCYVDRMKKGDPNDPLLKQVLSTVEESKLSDNFSLDPLKEADHNPVPGLLHKFSNRVLLTFSSSCAIHCRFCFRRHFPYKDNNPGQEMKAALKYIQKHAEIFEVILSGGDPLMVQDKVLSLFLNNLSELKHIRLLRLHTRLPVVIPQRISEGLLNVFKEATQQIVFVYHINHPAEISNDICEGVNKLKQQGITVLNHTVLLKGINDNIECLKALSLALFSSGILPYYVNLLDPVQGASHFHVSLQIAKKLQQDLRDQLPGYLIPRFVKEIPYRKSKIPLDLLSD